MGWLVFFLVVALVGAAGVVVNVNRLRFTRALESDIRALRAVRPQGPNETVASRLPVPVERYRKVAIGMRAPVRTLKMRHAGTFRTSPTARPLPIRGEQVFAADPPGFVWTGNIHVAPGFWIDARDRLVDGKGSMRVLLDDTIRIADVNGQAIDEGAALRVLAEMPWFPTAFFDERYVKWSPIDERHARATLTLQSGAASCDFEFGPDGLPVRASAHRPRETGEMRPWGGTYRDYRRADGMLVPFEAEVSWELDGGRFTYAHWTIESFEYDRVDTATTA